MHHEHQVEDSPKKKKHGFFNHLFKLVTLGGLLVVLYKALAKGKKSKE